MMKIQIKPLSINEAFQGRRFKTPKYRAYEKQVLMILKPLRVGNTKLSLKIIVGYSNKAADIDNCAKVFIDILQKKYNFNDSQIYELHLYKDIVKKGNEYIEFKIEEL